MDGNDRDKSHRGRGNVDYRHWVRPAPEAVAEAPVPAPAGGVGLAVPLVAGAVLLAAIVVASWLRRRSTGV
jgi:hypothetical protein